MRAIACAIFFAAILIAGSVRQFPSPLAVVAGWLVAIFLFVGLFSFLFRRRVPDKVVATAEFTTVPPPTEEDDYEYQHLLVYLERHDGSRYSRVETEWPDQAKIHSGINVAERRWKYHGELVPWSHSMSAGKTAKLLIFKGDKK